MAFRVDSPNVPSENGDTIFWLEQQENTVQLHCKIKGENTWFNAAVISPDGKVYFTASCVPVPGWKLKVDQD